MKTKASKRLLCAFLMVFLVLPTLIAGIPLKTSAAGVTYTVTGASSGSVTYVGRDYRDGSTGQSLTFELNSGFTMQDSNGNVYYATCIYAGAKDPPIGTQFTERFGIGSTTLTDGLLQGAEKGAHYVVNAKNGKEVSSSASNFDPTVGSGRQIDANFVFSCWYWGYQYQNSYSGVTFSNNLLQEAIAIAYRYEWDTRLIKYGNTYHKWADWQEGRDGMYTYWQQTPHAQWRTDAGHFRSASTNANIVEAANAILDAAITNPVRPTLEDGTMTYTNGGHTYEMFTLSGPQRPDDTRHYQDLLLFREVTEPPPTEEYYSIDLTKVDKDNHSVPLSGADFDLYKKNASGRYEWYDDGTTDSSGHILWDYLEEGEYRISETKAPSGYEKISAYIYVTLPGSGSSGSSSYIVKYTSEGSEVTVYDPKAKGNLQIKKVDIKGNPISGVTFGVYTSSNKTGYVKSATTDSYGVATFTDLVPGTYYLFETDAPSDYKINPNKYYTGIVESDTTKSANGGYGVPNPPKDFTLQIVKHIDGSIFTYVPGAKFQLYQKQSYGYVKYGSEKTTDDMGTVKWTELPVGDYYYVETYVPKGYKLDTTPHYLHFSEDSTSDSNGKGYLTVDIYEPIEAYWTPQVEKKLTRSFDTAGEPESNFGEFSFVLKEWNGRDWVDIDHKSIVGSGTVTFNELKFYEADAGTHKYRVYEETGSNNRVSYDDHYVEFTVTVTYIDSSHWSEGDRMTISTSVSSNQHPASASDKEKTTFTNYVPDGTWTPTAQKVLIGRKLTDKEFTFTLEENVSGTWKTLQTKQNTADGTVPFEEIYYTLANVGTHTYRISEVKGSDSTVIYDVHTVEFKVSVTYDGKNGTALTITESASSPMSIKYSYTGSGLHATSISAETTYEDYSIPAIQLTRTITYSDTNQVVTDTITVPAHRTNTMIRPASLVVFALQAKNYVFNEDPVLDAKNFQWTWYSNSTNKYQSASEYLADNPSIAYFTYNPSDTTIRASSSITRNGMIGTLTVFTNYVPVKIEIEKDDPNGHTLAGAEFCLQWSEDGKSWANVKYTAEIEKGGCENADVVDGKLTTDDDGKIAYERLYPGLHYRLTETKAPSGMQLLTETAYEGVLPPDMDVTDPETLVSLRVVNQPVFTLPATGGHGFWNAALAVPLLCVSIAIIGLALGGGSFKKKKQK